MSTNQYGDKECDYCSCDLHDGMNWWSEFGDETCNTCHDANLKNGANNG